MKTVPRLSSVASEFRARGNRDRFSEDFAPWPGRVGCRLLLLRLTLVLLRRRRFFVSLFRIVH